MQLTMTLSNMIALFGAMLVLAAMPSSSVVIVGSRSVTSGCIHGVLAVLGIVVGDIIFILIAILGLSLLAETMGDLFVLVKYLGGVYLVWLGTGLLIAKPGELKAEKSDTSMSSSFISGLLFTLADQKAVLFYLGFFPAFINLSSLAPADNAVILLIALIAVGGVKLAYAFMADSAVSLLTHRVRRVLNLVSGSLMLAVGVFVIVKL